ncbi:hypothetical protein BDR03DRAFT_951136 [Suillus americanus]|nr:hypothetical protein BDR03DRAFT_951136 [Suillus americanus]
MGTRTLFPREEPLPTCIYGTRSHALCLHHLIPALGADIASWISEWIAIFLVVLFSTFEFDDSTSSVRFDLN